MTADFRIDGQVLTSTNPIVEPGEPDSYGVQGNGVEVVGPFTSVALSWSYLTTSDFQALKNKIDLLNGGRASVTIPITGDVWETRTANVKLRGGYQFSYYGVVLNVQVLLWRIS